MQTRERVHERKIRPPRVNARARKRWSQGAAMDLLQERGVELQVDMPPELPEVRVDPVQLQQALIEIEGLAVLPEA